MFERFQLKNTIKRIHKGGLDKFKPEMTEKIEFGLKI